MTRSWDDADVGRVGERIAELAAGLPGVVVEESFGHLSIRLGSKRLAWVLVDHHGDGRLALCVKAPPGELESLLEADPARYFRPKYVRHWVGVELFEVAPDWAEIGALLEQAWRMLAGKRAVLAYDAAKER
ncbi:MmcQ/YjbR family DNA-binding protein [Nonomuraea typhae]|uniref:MmcQ/YjbR family DNA-binding protein n=1 Tax=Nonomuraea typhae TaxID=2603600 RepID=UPI0012FBBE29|nr:MmcQ/YjbR family DNA-binding protein [Nonomuraea typhae]